MNHRGLTLLEVLVAIAIVAVVMIPMMLMFPVRLGASIKSEHITTGLFLASQKMEEIRRLASSSNPSYGFDHDYTASVTPFDAPFEGYKFRVTPCFYGEGAINFLTVTVWYDADNDNHIDENEQPAIELDTKLAKRYRY